MTDASPAWLQWQGVDLVLHVIIQPRASKDEIAGPQGDRLKIRITAPPVDGQANQHLIRFLAKIFKVPKSRVQIESGESGRLKRIRIQDPQQLPAFLEEFRSR
jgi:uncharacterized protein (TIGR00251 family)